VFQITAFRTFSKTATWATVRDILGRYPTLDDLADGSFGTALDTARQRNGGLYTGAFILCATDAYGQPSKHRNHVELFRHMFLPDQLGARLLEARSLREVYGLLHGYPLMGDFMSYQTAIDLNYSALTGFSENDFTQPGPGALRGMKKCFEDPGDYTPAEIVLWMTERQDEELARLGLPVGLQPDPRRVGSACRKHQAARRQGTGGTGTSRHASALRLQSACFLSTAVKEATDDA
jgi:hypothetical protein